MENQKKNLLTELWKHALTTAVGVVITIFVTNMLKEKELDDRKRESDQERAEAITTLYKQLNECMADKQTIYKTTNAEPSTTLQNTNLPSHQSKAVSANGKWKTPDESLVWEFSNGRLKISGLGDFSGIMEATGSYNSSNQSIKGNVMVNQLLYVPVNFQSTINLTMSYDGKTLFGTTTDSDGEQTPITLNRM